MTKINVAICVAHPIQHEIPLFQELSKIGSLNVTVIYFSDFGVKNYNAYGLKNISYGVPMLEGYTYTIVKNASPFSSFKLKYINPDIFKTLQEGKYDKVILYGYYAPTHQFIMWYCKKHKIPIYLRAEGESIQPVSWLKRLFRSIYLPYIFKRFNYFLALCEANSSQYLEFGVENKNIKSIPQTVNDVFFANFQVSNFELLRKKYQLSPDNLIFIYGSKQREEKRPMDAVQAFCQLPEAVNAKLIMLSDGPCRKECEDYANLYDSARRIVFTGYIEFEEMRDLFAMSDVLLITSFETIGATLYQALFSGLGILTSDMVPGWLDVVKPGWNGIVYRAAWIEALVKSIISMSENPALVKQMKSNSKLLSYQYQSDVTARKLAEVMLQNN